MSTLINLPNDDPLRTIRVHKVWAETLRAAGVSPILHSLPLLLVGSAAINCHDRRSDLDFVAVLSNVFSLRAIIRNLQHERERFISRMKQLQTVSDCQASVITGRVVVFQVRLFVRTPSEDTRSLGGTSQAEGLHPMNRDEESEHLDIVFARAQHPMALAARFIQSGGFGAVSTGAKLRSDNVRSADEGSDRSPPTGGFINPEEYSFAWCQREYPSNEPPGAFATHCRFTYENTDRAIAYSPASFPQQLKLNQSGSQTLGYLLSGYVPEHLPVDDMAEVIGHSLISQEIAALDVVFMSCWLLENVVHSIHGPQFCSAVRSIKNWCKAVNLYGSKFGLLSGAGIAVSVVCLLDSFTRLRYKQRKKLAENSGDDGGDGNERALSAITSEQLVFSWFRLMSSPNLQGRPSRHPLAISGLMTLLPRDIPGNTSRAWPKYCDLLKLSKLLRTAFP